MADRLVVMQDGAVRQVGTQQDLYERPTRSVRRRFCRSLDLHRGRDRGARPISLCTAGSASPAPAATLGPATLALAPRAHADRQRRRRPAVDNNLPGVVEFVSYLGATVDMHVRISPKERVVVQIPEPGRPVLCRRWVEQVQVAWPGRQRHRLSRLPVILSATRWRQNAMRKSTSNFPSRRHVLEGAASAHRHRAGRLAARRGRAGEGQGRGWYLGWRLCAPPQQEHRAAYPDQGWLGGDPGSGRRSGAALKMLAERRLPRGTTDRAGPLRPQHVSDARRRRDRRRSTTASSRTRPTYCRP